MICSETLLALTDLDILDRGDLRIPFGYFSYTDIRVRIFRQEKNRKNHALNHFPLDG
jgi:hypothetical protein